MHLKMLKLLESISGKPINGIYSGKRKVNESQAKEKLLRERVANESYKDYLDEIAKHHSIPVMDHEVDRFLEKIPKNGMILDIGGCWGWHWRRLAVKRPDVNVLIIDFIDANLIHAQNLLGELIGTQVALMDADAIDLPFLISNDFIGFDGVWSVQTFQHIPDFSKAVGEVERVLKKGGVFMNYSLHKTPLNMLVYFLVGKKYHIEGEIPGSFYLSRASKKQIKIVELIFGKKIGRIRYTECLFQPDFKVTFAGNENSLLGCIDLVIGSLPWLGYWIARQQSFEVIK